MPDPDWLQPPADEHEWLRLAEAAEFMGVSPRAMSYRARRGRLPFVSTQADDGSGVTI